MEVLQEAVSSINGVVWGPLMLVLLLGVGLYLQIGLRGMPIRNLGRAFTMLWQGRRGERDSGEISSFNALMTSLSATIGTGNIAGVATAIALGGPGAVFWMWLTALVGMATQYAEAVCAVRFRERDEGGNYVGGPMYYIRNGLGQRFAWLGGLFALFGALAAFGIGNTVQANSVADALSTSFSIPAWLTGLVIMALAVFAFTTILGWSYYGERCFQYLFGSRAARFYRIAFVLMIPVGAMAQLDFIWLLADTFNALMAIPNLIALALLSPLIFRLTREYFTSNQP